MNKPFFTNGLTTFWPNHNFETMNEHFNLGVSEYTVGDTVKPKDYTIFTTNGNLLKPEQKAVKFDQGKLDWSLMPFEALEEVAKVLEYGKTKYSAHNWSSGEGFKYSRVFSALMRHTLAFMRGEDNDPETGLSHIAHAACNILFLLHFIKFKEKYNTCDDRQ